MESERRGSAFLASLDDPSMDPTEDTLDDLASEWSAASEEEDRIVWGE